jgi:hypothetical protein
MHLRRTRRRLALIRLISLNEISSVSRSENAQSVLYLGSIGDLHLPPYAQWLVDQMNELIEERTSMARDVVLDYASHNYRTNEGRDFGKHGFGRRLTTMWKCAQFVFEVLPPEQEEVPEAEAREKAAIYLQSFVLNSFGCTDCLAWVWAYEKNVRNAQGRRLDRMQIGIHPNQQLRQKLPADLQGHMITIDRWFAGLKDVRDALMHRIPIYIPPYFVVPERLDAYNALSARMQDALAREDLDEYRRLEVEQDALGHYLPLISYTSRPDAHRQAEIHRLILGDLLTISDLGQRFMVHLRQ